MAVKIKKAIMAATSACILLRSCLLRLLLFVCLRPLAKWTLTVNSTVSKIHLTWHMVVRAVGTLGVFCLGQS